MDIDVQGHRGCRGLMPENTIPAFLKALDLGVNTLEMDAVVSAEEEIIISHEPFMSHEIALQPNGSEILELDQLNHNIYKLTYNQIKLYDTGSKLFDRFPDQNKMVTHKPTLQDVVTQVNKKLQALGRSSVNYNIEIKRRTEWDFVHHPPFQEFADLMIKSIKSLGIEQYSTVQCFDIETLRYIHRKYPEIKLVFLVSNKLTPQVNIAELGFLPHVYSPYYKLVNTQLVKYCNDLNMKIIPWTVNDNDDINKMISLGVSGIISDYPDRVMKILNKLH